MHIAFFSWHKHLMPMQHSLLVRGGDDPLLGSAPWHNRCFSFSSFCYTCTASYLPLFSVLPAKADIILPVVPFIPLFYATAPYLPWQTSCSGWAPFSCPKTFCLCFASYLFLWSLFPILFPGLMTCSANHAPDVLSCKTIFHSLYPLRA